MPSCRLPLCSTPSAAVAVNLLQLDAFASQSRFSRRNSSLDVPAFMNAFDRLTAEWYAL